MNRMSTDEIVDHLTGELKPVKRTIPPILGTALWLTASTAFIGALVWHHGMRPDIGRLLDDTGYRTLFAACVATAALGALATFMVSLPDRTVRWALLPMPGLVLWLAGTGIGCYADWVRAGPDGLVLGTSFSCMEWIISVSLPPVALLIVMIRHAAFVRPRLSLCLGMLSTSALASAGLMMFHEIDATLMIFVWHTLAAVILTGLAGISAPMFRRFAGVHWRR
ncbi:MAG: DUF1109 domain-containing protein [Rhodospirillales bacterium]|nr:DUF1109 domain-containing protein [Rhodospirillales bacterium]